jgi:hypothetical protein
MATELEKLKAKYAELDQRYKSLDVVADTAIAKFIKWKHSTAVVVAVLILAVFGSVWLTAG